MYADGSKLYANNSVRISPVLPICTSFPLIFLQKKKNAKKEKKDKPERKIDATGAASSYRNEPYVEYVEEGRKARRGSPVQMRAHAEGICHPAALNEFLVGGA